MSDQNLAVERQKQVDPRSLGLCNIVFEQPSKDQKRAFPHIAAQLKFSLILNVTDPDAKTEDMILDVQGFKITRSTKEETFGQLFLIGPNFQYDKTRPPFYPINRLGALQTAYLLERFKAQEALWNAQPTLPEDMPLTITVKYNAPAGAASN